MTKLVERFDLTHNGRITFFEFVAAFGIKYMCYAALRPYSKNMTHAVCHALVPQAPRGFRNDAPPHPSCFYIIYLYNII